MIGCRLVMRSVVQYEKALSFPSNPGRTFQFASALYVIGSLLAAQYSKTHTYIPLHPIPGPQGGELVEVCDTWIDNSHPATLMGSAAFTKVRSGGSKPRARRDG